MRIDEQTEIDESELSFATSRSSGPGGQNVNKVESRVTLRFDVERSAGLSDEQKARVHSRLAGRISKEGTLHISSQEHRTQAANRKAATERFVELLGEALKVERPRKPTKTPAAVRRRRIDAKRQRGRLKETRRKPPGEE